MRRRNVKNAKERLLAQEEVMIFNPTDYKGKWHELFNNNNPIYLEIGMGKGKFIIKHAQTYPNHNYLGLEKYDSVILQATTKLQELSLDNLKLINVDASNLLEIFQEGEVDGIYLNFSDPWPKSRHEKRRLTSEAFLNVYKKVLIDNGFIEFKTDNRKLFEYSLMKFNELQYEMVELSLDLHSDKEDIITTEYEDKFTNLGQVIYFIKVRIK